MNPDEFKTPPDHVRFLARKLFGPGGRIADGAIAYLEPGGGGPQVRHTHAHDHLFIVVSGQARIEMDDETVIVNENESYLVPGRIPHSVWNPRAEGTTVMVGLSVFPDQPSGG